ncbi:MAG: hypothetical protein IT184_07970 [Acidobacteria bacterium]|nr:hypothetical protein [Acidobacteriota bacterium]
MATAVLAATGANAQERKLALEFAADGTVTLAANGVSVRDIIAEWRRLCGCHVVNGDRLSPAIVPVPLEFVHVPQARVLEALLRQATGYALTPRRAGHAGVSQFETIYIVASSQTSAVGAPPPFTPVVRPAPIIPTPGSPDDEIPPVQPGLPPRPSEMEPPATEPPAAASRPAGVSVPAVIVPIGPSRGGAPATPAPGLPTPMPQAPSAPQPARP